MFQKSLTINLPINLSAATAVLIFACSSIISFSIPFYLGGPQWLVGTVVNIGLFSGAFFLPKKYILPLAVFPSLGVLFRGIIFGPLTIFLIYFLPFIWLSNLILIAVFRKTLPSFNYLPSVFLAALVKFLFLLTVANVYFSFSIVPKVFLQSIGVGQFLTALAGGIIFWTAIKSYERYNSGNKKTA